MQNLSIFNSDDQVHERISWFVPLFFSQLKIENTQYHIVSTTLIMNNLNWETTKRFFHVLNKFISQNWPNSNYTHDNKFHIKFSLRLTYAFNVSTYIHKIHNFIYPRVSSVLVWINVCFWETFIQKKVSCSWL